MREGPRVAALLAEGKLDRALRSLDELDRGCPARVPGLWALRLRTLSELGACDLALSLAAAVSGASPETEQAAEQARSLCASPGLLLAHDEVMALRKLREGLTALADGKLAEAEATCLLSWRVSRPVPGPEALACAGRAARAAGREADAQRLLDRALHEATSLTNERPRLFVSGDLHGETWQRRGDQLSSLASLRMPDGLRLSGIAFFDLHGDPLRFWPMEGVEAYNAQLEVAFGQVFLAQKGVRELDARTGLQRREIAPEGDFIRLSPDGKRIAIWTRSSEQLAIRELVANTVALTLPANSPQMAWSPDGGRVALIRAAAGHRGERVVVVDLSTKREITSFVVPPPTIRPTELSASASSLAFHPDGTTLAIGLANGERRAIRMHEVGGSLGLLDLATGRLRVSRVEMRPDEVGYSRDGSLIALVCGGDNVMVPGKVFWLLAKDLKPAGDLGLGLNQSAGVGENGDIQVSTDNQAPLLVRGPPQGQEISRRIPLSTASVRSVAVVGATLRLFSLYGESRRDLGAGCPDTAEAVALAADDSRLAFACADHIVRVWDLRRGVLLAQLPQNQPVRSLALDAHGGWLAVSLRGAKVRRFTTETGALAGEIEVESRSVAVGSDGSLAVVPLSPTNPSALLFLPPGNNPTSLDLGPEAGAPWALAWEPDGRSLAVGTTTGHFFLIDPATNKPRELRPFPGQEGPRGAIMALAWHPTRGELVALGGGQILSLDTRLGQLLYSHEILLQRESGVGLAIDARSELLTVSTPKSVFLVRPGEAQERLVVRVLGQGVAIADNGRGEFELLHPEARSSMWCAARGRLLPFEVCEESGLSPGLRARVTSP